MSVSKAFEDFVEELVVKNEDDILYRFGRITKKLNEKYWEIKDDKVSNGMIVGSLGRETAINGVSDLDMNFELPWSIHKKYDSYESNGQSALLQDVKSTIQETYPNTAVSGDGQVVVITFSSTNDVIEVCPSFRNSDNSFTYPDSNNGGKWKKTNPIPEIDESKKMNDETNGVFKDLCFLTRAWKNNIGFKMGGLLIDTLVYKFLNDNEEFKEAEYDDYFEMIKAYFSYLKDLNEEQSFWYALGSNQKVSNKDKGKFISKAKKAFGKLDCINEDDEEVFDKLIEIFGSKFPDYSEEEVVEKSTYALATKAKEYAPYEQFIDKMYPLDIRYNVEINCNVKQSNGKIYSLRDMPYISSKSNLHFYIEENEVPKPYKVLWKVRNRGLEAKKKNMFRGQIEPDAGLEQKIETADFAGQHYVECYIIKNGVCVARDRIPVNILKFPS